MKQTRLESLKESIWNATVGYPLGWFVHFALISHFILWLSGFGISQTGVIMAAAVTAVYWHISVIRCYCVRRYHNNKIPERGSYGHYIVCSAWRLKGKVYLCIRHSDLFARRDFFSRKKVSDIRDSGFVDNYGKYHNRVDALAIAKKANQIRDNNVGGGETELFSEMVW